MLNLKYFTYDEFKRVSDEECLINEDSARRLDRAREIAGVPFVLTSAFRSVQTELSKGRSGHGAHTLGCAFDVRCRNSAERYSIVFGALAAGFSRIGIGKNFVHMDDASTLPTPRIWLY